MSRALEGSQRGEQRDHEAKKVNAASPRTITCRTVTGWAGMKVGDGLGWPGHHLAHPAHPRYAPAQGQQQQEKVKTFLRDTRLAGSYPRRHLGGFFGRRRGARPCAAAAGSCRRGTRRRPPHLPIRRQAARDGVSQERRKNVGEMAGEARLSREMAAARGLNGDPAQARRDSPNLGRRHDGRGHLAAIFRRARGC